MNQARNWLDRAQRHDVELEGVAYRPDNTKVQIKLSNISYPGCCMSTDRKLMTGERIRLIVDGLGEIDARVKWSEENKAGTAFVTEAILITKRQFRYGGSQSID